MYTINSERIHLTKRTSNPDITFSFHPSRVFIGINIRFMPRSYQRRTATQCCGKHSEVETIWGESLHKSFGREDYFQPTLLILIFLERWSEREGARQKIKTQGLASWFLLWFFTTLCWMNVNPLCDVKNNNKHLTTFLLLVDVVDVWKVRQAVLLFSEEKAVFPARNVSKFSGSKNLI